MFETSLVKSLRKEIEEQKQKIAKMEFMLARQEDEKKTAKGLAEIEKEKALAELRKEMQQALVESDIRRTEAVAKLEVYEKMDVKNDANVIKEMVSKLIENIGKNNGVSILR